MPRISIVTPSFNQGAYIEQTINSVLDQNYPNLEYIIIDGGSTDHTVEIIKKYEKHLSYWVSERDKGQTDAINKGFEKCTGDLFNWINSDDYYEPGVFEKLATFFSDEYTDVVCGKEWGFNNERPEERTLHPGSVIKNNLAETLRIGIIDQPCTFFRKKKIEHFFPLDDSLRYVMDRQLWWSYLLQYGQDNIRQTDEIFTNFRLHPMSKSVEEGDQFEAEFDRLKRSLFKQLHAPAFLREELSGNDNPLDRDWNIDIANPDLLLAEFASYFAERNYVKNDLEKTAVLVKYLRTFKNRPLKKNEWKYWLAANVLPRGFVKGLKKIKN